MNNNFKNKEEETIYRLISKISNLIEKGFSVEVAFSKFKNKKHLIEKYIVFFEEFENLKALQARSSFKINTFEEITRGNIYESEKTVKAYDKDLDISSVRVRKRRILLKPALVFFVFLLIFSFSYAGTAYASQDSLPGETLYPVKISSEKIYVFFSLGSNKGKAHFNILNRRLGEAYILIEKGVDYNEDSFTYVMDEIDRGFKNCKRYGYFNSKSEEEIIEEIECIKNCPAKGSPKGKGKN